MQAGRKIKFRAWHKQEKRMIDPVINLDFAMPNPTIAWYETMDDALDGSLTDAFLEDVELMQFTGLRDKNGKEVYEGDIAKNKHGAVGIIKFHKSWGAFYFHTVLGLNEENELVRMSGAVPMWNDWGTLTVLGNIYENPELLEAI